MTYDMSYQPKMSSSDDDDTVSDLDIFEFIDDEDDSNYQEIDEQMHSHIIVEFKDSNENKE